jgi:hypothetical protein
VKKPAIQDVRLPPGLQVIASFCRDVKSNLDVLTGRLNNRLDPVNVRQLTAVAAPTKAEYDKLAAYVSEVATLLNQVIARMDE